MHPEIDNNLFGYEKEYAMQSRPFFQFNPEQPLAGLENSYPIFGSQFMPMPSYMGFNNYNILPFSPNQEMQLNPFFSGRFGDMGSGSNLDSVQFNAPLIGHSSLKYK
jgi:hypothetical protein